MSNVVLNPGAGGSTLGTDLVGGIDYQIVKPGFSDPGGVPTQVSSSNPLPVVAATLPLPAGAATAAKQPAIGVAGTPSVDVISVQGEAGMTPVKVDGSATTQPVSGTVTANQGGAPWSENIAQIGGAALSEGQKLMAASIPVVMASDQSAIPVSGTVTSNQGGAPWSQNLTQVGGAALTEGQKAMSASVPIVIASDQSAVPISGTVTTSPPANASTNVAQFGGSAVVTGTGVSAAGVPRVTVSSDSFPATQAVSGTVTANQGGAPWTENVTQFGGTNISTGTGAGGAGIPRVTISSDSSLAANQSVNVAQFAGAAAVTGTGIAGVGIPRVTVSSDSFPATQAVSQSGAPWAENVTQFGSNPVLTGTGVGGVGVPRVTVSSDSQMRVWDGTNQAAVKAASTAAVAADPALVVAISPNNTINANIAASISANNTTTAALGANAVFTGTQDLGESFENFQVSCFSDQNGSLQVQWSSDGANWDMNETFAYVAANGMMTLGLPTRSRRYRIVYTNGSVAQVSFRLQTIMRHVAAAGDTTAIREAIPVNLQAQATRSQLIGQTDASAAAFAAATIKDVQSQIQKADKALVVMEGSGALQRIADLLEALLIETKVHGIMLTQFSQANVDDPDQIRDAITTSLN